MHVIAVAAEFPGDERLPIREAQASPLCKPYDPHLVALVDSFHCLGFETCPDACFIVASSEGRLPRVRSVGTAPCFVLDSAAATFAVLGSVEALERGIGSISTDIRSIETWVARPRHPDGYGLVIPRVPLYCHIT